MTDYPNIHELTRFNEQALPIYREACRILALPKHARRAEIDKHPHSERLAAEVTRVHRYRLSLRDNRTPDGSNQGDGGP
jgi:hypothetical protein